MQMRLHKLPLYMSCITLYSCVMEAFINAGVATFFEFHVGSSGFLTKIAEAASGGSQALIIRLMLVFNLNERLT